MLYIYVMDRKTFWEKTKALFSSEKISDFAIIAFLFLFEEYCPIVN